MDLFLINAQLSSSQDIAWWTGVVWITCGLLWCFYQLFGLSCFTAEDPLLSKWCNASFLQIWWRNTLIHILDGLRVSTFSANFHFWVNFIFNTSNMFKYATQICSVLQPFVVYISLSLSGGTVQPLAHILPLPARKWCHDLFTSWINCLMVLFFCHITYCCWSLEFSLSLSCSIPLSSASFSRFHLLFWAPCPPFSAMASCWKPKPLFISSQAWSASKSSLPCPACQHQQSVRSERRGGAGAFFSSEVLKEASFFSLQREDSHDSICCRG